MTFVKGLFKTKQNPTSSLGIGHKKTAQIFCAVFV